MNDPVATQKIIDELRGELDRKYGQDPGWSGPATKAYMRGYGSYRRADHEEQSRRSEVVKRGWY
jgi:hypothetical protein